MKPRETDSVASTLLAILLAAKRAGDRELERHARKELRERYGISLNFARERAQQKGVTNE